MKKIDLSKIKGGEQGKPVGQLPDTKRCIHGITIGHSCFGCFVKNTGN